ncbi:MAG: SatD family protein [Cyclobacteriaceae bacterium]|jgi:hypothetical protein|nr:SatD family protein [Cyclobacteriaceae bacterium]
MKIILMADVVDSSKRKGKALMGDFSKLVAEINDERAHHVLSPLTITLGDEFQGVVKNPQVAVEMVLDLEKKVMSLKTPFMLRYVIHEGEIQTRLNRVRAHEMLGPGLTEARSKLLEMKTSKARFFVSLENKGASEKLNILFSVLQGISDQWTSAQRKVATAFFERGDYRAVAEYLKKDPTTIWRRKKSLMIEEYYNVQKLIRLTVPAK